MSTPLIDTQTLAELQANAGSDFVVELVDTFAEEAPRLLAELRSSFASGGVDAFRRAAHSLKSNSNTFGASALAELARSLELGGLPATAEPIDALASELTRSVAALQALAREAHGG
jgi:histidine phosphotransfer protein HptB